MGLTSLLILSVIFICFIICLKKPVAGVVGYIIVYSLFNTHVWYGQQMASILIRPSFAAVLMLSIGSLINFNKLNWLFSRREMEIYLFVAVMFAVSFIFGIGVDDNSWKYLIKMFKLAVFLFLLFRVVHTLKDFKIVIWTLILCAFFLSWQARQIGHYAGGRLNNIGGVDFGEANAFASFVVMNIIFLGFKLFGKPLWRKIVMIFTLAVMLNAMIMTQSRSVFIGLFFVSIYVVWSSPKIIKKEILLYLLCAVLGFSFLAQGRFWNRMGTIDQQAELLRQEDSLLQGNRKLSRVDFWRASIDIFRDHPMGIGVKNFEKIVPLYDPRNPGRDAHNTYVLCYSEIGIIGIILFLIIIAESFLQLRRIKRLSERNGHQFEIQITVLSLTAALVLFVTGSMVTHSYLYSEFSWLLFSLPICLENALNSAVPEYNNNSIA